MKSTLRILSLMLASVLLGGCWGDSETWHQKLKVTVETPEGVVSGEAVSKLKMIGLTGAEQALTGRAVRGSLESGEATVVALPNGKHLFALLGPNDDSLYLPFYTFLQDFPAAYPDYVEAAREFKLVKGPRDVPIEKYPTFVTFSDASDPTTVRLVDAHNLKATFGEDYDIASVTLEITNDYETTGSIEKILPFLLQSNPIFVDWKMYPNGHPLREITRRSFVQGNH